MFVSLFRQSSMQAHGQLIGTASPADTVSLFFAGATPGAPFRHSVLLPTTTATMDIPFHYQAWWSDPLAGIRVSRVTELPIHN
jgi:hypothetical protein